MPTPLDLIRQGIETRSWGLVSDGYHALTGQRVFPPPDGGDHLPFLKRLHEIIGNRLNGPAVPEPKPTQVEVADDRNEDEDEDEDEDEPVKPAPDPEPARPEPAASPRRGDKLPDFSIEHSGTGARETDAEKGTRCKTLPLDTQNAENRFRDDQRIAAREIDESQRLSQQFKGRDTRPEYKSVRKICSRCDRKFDVHPDVIPRRCDPKDEEPSFLCDRCISQAIK